MKKQFELNALKKHGFVAPVVFEIPTDEMDKKGNTVFVKTGFMGHFQKQTPEEQKAMREKLQAVEKNVEEKRQAVIDAAGDNDPSDLKLRQITQEGMEQIKALTNEGMRQYFTGFSKHPLYEFPILINGQVPEPTPDIIDAFLEESFLSGPIANAYLDIVNNVKSVLEGNSRK